MLVTLDTTIRVSDIVTVAITIASFVSLFIWMKLAITRHEIMLFNASGEPRLVSFEALERQQVVCRTAIASDAKHQDGNVNKLTTEITSLSNKIDQLSRCVTILASGGNVKDC